MIFMNLPISIHLIFAVFCPLITISMWQQMNSRVQAQNTPECFMISEQGNTIDLSLICLTSTSFSDQIDARNRLRQETREDNSIPEGQDGAPPQFTQEILRGTAALSELDAIYLRNTVPNFYEEPLILEHLKKDLDVN